MSVIHIRIGPNLREPLITFPDILIANQNIERYKDFSVGLIVLGET